MLRNANRLRAACDGRRHGNGMVAHPMHDQGIKQCSRCEATKPRTEFNVRRRACDGLRAECRDCQKADAARYRVAHPDQFRVYYAENADRLNAYTRAYYAANAEALRRDAVARYERNSDERKEGVRRYRREHPERVRVWQDNRRARKLQVQVESVSRLVVLERDDGICGICGGDVDPFAFHVDHVVPLSRGGEHSYANVQVAHPQCNMRKHTREVD